MTTHPAPRRRFAVLTTLLFAATALAGCLADEPAAATPAAAPATREIRMWVEPLDWEIAPGVTTPVWAFCGEGDGVEPVHGEACGVPGPTVRVQKGDTIRLTLENTHAIPHTVHFHGWHAFPVDLNGNHVLHQDMVVGAGETKTFEWVAEPAGTFIYHCHFETPEHMEMGMSGAFIVEDPAEAEADKPDKEYVAVIDEWAIHEDSAAAPRHGNMPAYNYFTINGKSFPLTQPWFADKGDRVRLHFVNAGYEFHALHVHGYTPLAWEGVAGPGHAVPTDVREIAPGQSVVLELTADREGVWLSHDHVVPRVTAGSDGAGFGAYPRGMLTALVVGKAYQDKFLEIAPALVEAARKDAQPGGAGGHDGHGPEGSHADALVQMKDYEFQTTELRVKAGDTVVWMNRDAAPHTVTADDGSFDSGDIAPGKSFRMTFDEPGTYSYHCTPHAGKDKQTGQWKGMVGTVIVE